MQFSAELILFHPDKPYWRTKIRIVNSPEYCCDYKLSFVEIFFWNDLWCFAHHFNWVLSYSHQGTSSGSHFDQHFSGLSNGSFNWTIQVFLLFYEFDWSHYCAVYWSQRPYKALKSQENDWHHQRILLRRTWQICKNIKRESERSMKFQCI